MDAILLLLWGLIAIFGATLFVYFTFDLEAIKGAYFRNEGKILLLLTFALCALFLIILDFINLINLQ